MKRFIYIVPFLGIISTGCMLFQTGGLGKANGSSQTSKQILVGYFENRDPRYNPFTSSNFTDMLSFELLRRGYRVIEFEKEIDSQETKEPVIKDIEKNTKKKEEQSNEDKTDVKKESEEPAQKGQKVKSEQVDDLSGILPDYLRNIAGEKNTDKKNDLTKKLGTKEIQQHLTKNKIDFYIQGAISRSESGLLLDVKEYSLVFIELYNNNGRRIAMFNYHIKGKTLHDSEFLEKVCNELGGAIEEAIKNNK